MLACVRHCVQGGGTAALPLDLQIASEDIAEVEKAATALFQWYETLFSEPGATASWVTDRLEYAFSVATRLSDGECTLTAKEVLRRPSRLGGFQHQRRGLDGRGER